MSRVRLPGGAGRLHERVAPLDRRGVLARADQDLMLGQHRVNVAAQLDPGRGQQDEVVADPFEIGDQMRGQHDGEAAVGHRVGQDGQEVPPGERVERGDGLVEQQQPGLLGQRQRQRHLGPLPAGQRAHGLVKRDVQARRAAAAPTRRPSAGLRCAPMPMWSSALTAAGTAGSPGRGSRCRRGRPGPGAGVPPSTATSPRGRPGQPGEQPQQRGLAGAVRADQRGDPALGNGDRAVAQRGDPAVALGQPAGLDHGRDCVWSAITRSPPRPRPAA